MNARLSERSLSSARSSEMAPCAREAVDQLLELVATAVADRLSATLSGSGEEPWRLLDEDEAASRLGRSPSWLRKRAREGAMPFVQLDAGGGRMYALEDLRAFAEARRIGPDRGEVLEGRLKLARKPASEAGSRHGDQVGDRRVDR